MKRVLVILLMCVCLSVLFARTYEIKVLNTPSINIGGKILKVGEHFDSSEPIYWVSDKQAMKVLSDDNKVYVLSKNLMDKQHAKSFADYITSVKSASVRNDGGNFPVTVADHRALFENDFVLLDSISITVGWRTNETSFFEACTNNLGDRNFSFSIPSEENTLTISRKALSPMVESVGDKVSLNIKYIELEYNDTTLITDSMIIEIVPVNLEEK